MKVESESEVTQSCLTLSDPMDCSPPGSSIHGIFRATVLEWIAYPSPADLSNPRIESGSPALQTDSLPTELSGKPLEGLKRMKKLSKGEFTPSAQLLPHEQGYFSSVF